jgi:hypothetical protein
MEAARRAGAVEASFDDREAEEKTKACGPAIAERTTENENANVDALARPRNMF